MAYRKITKKERDFLSMALGQKIKKKSFVVRWLQDDGQEVLSICYIYADLFTAYAQIEKQCDGTYKKTPCQNKLWNEEQIYSLDEWKEDNIECKKRLFFVEDRTNPYSPRWVTFVDAGNEIDAVGWFRGMKEEEIIAGGGTIKRNKNHTWITMTQNILGEETELDIYIKEWPPEFYADINLDILIVGGGQDDNIR